METKENPFGTVAIQLKDVDFNRYSSEDLKDQMQQSPEEVLKKICNIYKYVRPILMVVLNLPFVPAVVKTALKAFISIVDNVCS